jgi:hypothetical protein
MINTTGPYSRILSIKYVFSKTEYISYFMTSEGDTYSVGSHGKNLNDW